MAKREDVPKVVRKSTLGVIDPKKVAEEIQTYSAAAGEAEAMLPQLLGRFDKRWVAIWKGAVIADAESIESVLSRCDAEGAPRADVIFKYVDRNPPRLAL